MREVGRLLSSATTPSRAIDLLSADALLEPEVGEGLVVGGGHLVNPADR
jgi:hypothetical protein